MHPYLAKLIPYNLFHPYLSIRQDQIETKTEIQFYWMNIKKTEEFLYFQRKARHYANLRDAKPAVKTHRRSLTISPPDLHGMPYFQRYERERQNQGLIDRITEIMTGPRLQLQKQGYTRYNRQFSPKSQLAIEQKHVDETISEENQIMANKVLRVKPSIGTMNDWNRHFHANREIRSNISKYTSKRMSKGTIDVYTSSQYMPEHYRSFLGGVGPHQQESPEELSGNPKIRVQQLFQLPKLRKLRGSMTRIGENGQQVQHF